VFFTGLFHSQDQTKKYISLTLWQSQQDAEVYKQSGEYRKNLVVKKIDNEYKVVNRDDDIRSTIAVKRGDSNRWIVEGSGAYISFRG